MPEMAPEPTPAKLADLMQDVHEGYGDTRTMGQHMTNDTNFWQRALPQPAGPVPGSAEDYRSWQACTSGSLVYDQGYIDAVQNRGQVKLNHYDAVPAKTLDDYARTEHRSPHLPRPNESPTAYLARISIIARALSELPDAERKAIEAALAEAQERVAAGDSHEALRARLSVRAEGDGVGVTGNDSKALAATLAARAAAEKAARFGNHVGYQAISTQVPAVDLAGMRAADAQRQAAILQQRYAHAVPRNSGEQNGALA
jgi:hypothetical protein